MPGLASHQGVPATVYADHVDGVKAWAEGVVMLLISFLRSGDVEGNPRVIRVEVDAINKTFAFLGYFFRIAAILFGNEELVFAIN